MLTYKDGPRTERIKIFLTVVDHNTGIKINRKELTETFMTISNWKNPIGLHDLYKKYFSAIRVNAYHVIVREDDYSVITDNLDDNDCHYDNPDYILWSFPGMVWRPYMPA